MTRKALCKGKKKRILYNNYKFIELAFGHWYSRSTLPTLRKKIELLT